MREYLTMIYKMAGCVVASNSLPRRVPVRLLVTILILIVSTSLFLGGCGSPPPSQEEGGGNTGVNPALSRVVLEVPTIWCSR